LRRGLSALPFLPTLSLLASVSPCPKRVDALVHPVSSTTRESQHASLVHLPHRIDPLPSNRNPVPPRSARKYRVKRRQTGQIRPQSAKRGWTTLSRRRCLRHQSSTSPTLAHAYAPSADQGDTRTNRRKSADDRQRREPPVSLDVPAQNSRVKEPRGSGHTVPLRTRAQTTGKTSGDSNRKNSAGDQGRQQPPVLLDGRRHAPVEISRKRGG